MQISLINIVSFNTFLIICVSYTRIHSLQGNLGENVKLILIMISLRYFSRRYSVKPTRTVNSLNIADPKNTTPRRRYQLRSGASSAFFFHNHTSVRDPYVRWKTLTAGGENATHAGFNATSDLEFYVLRDDGNQKPVSRFSRRQNVIVCF